MKKVLAIFGGQSYEHEVSIMTATSVIKAIPYVQYKIYPVYVKDGEWYYVENLLESGVFVHFNPKNHKKVRLIGTALYYLKNKKWKHIDDLDVALLLTHGGEGENGELTGYLKLSGLAYTSADCGEMALCMDKYLLKLCVKDLGYKVVDGVVISDDCLESIESAVERLSYPIFVKPNSQGSSIGVGMAHSEEELLLKVKVAFEYDQRVLLERGMENFLEYNCAVMKVGERLIISEVESPVGSGEYLTFEDKYIQKEQEKGEKEQKIDENLISIIKAESEDLFRKLNLKGVVRFDYIYKDELYLNEVNTLPGSLATNLFKEYEESQLLSLLIDDAIDRQKFVPKVYPSEILTQGRRK